MAKMIKHMQYLLKMQRNNAFRAKNRHHGATHADYTHIYSDKSLTTHEKAVESFCKWAETQDIKRINQINHDVIGNYCLDLQKHGYSAWTIKCGITALNHIMVQTGHWDSNTVFSATTWNKQHKGNFSVQLKNKNRGEIWNNHRQTAEQWRKDHQTLYEHNKQLIDTARAFGVRKSELCHISKEKPALIANSFFSHQGKLYAFVPYGKGGRPRFAQCRSDLKNEMLGYYHFQPLTKLPASMYEVKNFRNLFVKRNEENYRKDHYIFDNHISGRLRFHIQRAEYANVRLTEEFTKWGRYNNTQKTINGVTGNIMAFKRVANDLGHGRIDVLGNYIGS